ncbi:hypothetical protein LAZ67_10001954 [Cordylochernes scorpioides]|uniref:Uncharacterized protein n=1 Tax=Cordylochernes scorpioides TaxID=51811 RepID=A0ABY6KYH0_9ARAC|nr:hypothetical protein LAZ67_10001954 [Cordylochernes scorpioides]
MSSRALVAAGPTGVCQLKSMYGNEAMDRSTIQYSALFQTSDSNISDKERPGKPTSVVMDRNLALMEELIKKNRTMTTYQIMENFPVYRKCS